MAEQDGPAAADRLRDGSATGSWVLDTARSGVRFRVKHFWGMVTVRGHFTRFEGEATVHPTGAIRGEMRIDASSVDTKNSRRDAHVRSAEFFDAENHPFITFSTRDVIAQDEDRLRVVGDLAAAGRTGAIEFEARVIDSTDERVVAEAEITMDRTRFGMTWSPMGMASATVRVTVRGELVRAPASSR
jgi:polyisoprenoid-binding protein YceI